MWAVGSHINFVGQRWNQTQETMSQWQGTLRSIIIIWWNLQGVVLMPAPLVPKELCFRVVRPSVRSPGFRAFPGKRIRSGLQFGMLMYSDHRQSYLDFCYGLFFPNFDAILTWETGQISRFRAFPNERIAGMACYFACRCIMINYRTGQIMVTVGWFSNFGTTLN